MMLVKLFEPRALVSLRWTF